jgi:CubicO group peptidase (beta-lactamase class C family)
MAKSRLQIVLIILAVPVVGIAALVAGLYIYVNATATPIHPDPNAVPSASGPAPSPRWTAAVEQARQAVRSSLTTQNLPGVSVAVGTAGEIVWAEGFGFADLEKRNGVTTETRFRIGEVSRPLTSAAVGLLVEKSRLNLDTDVQKYVPDFPEKQWPVTVRQLMAHVAGTREDAGDEASLSPCAKTLDGLRLFASQPLLFEPGTKYHPSSYGWILVSAAVEAAANEPFFSFMRTKVFEPLGMSATRPYSSTESIPNLPTFYFPRFGGDTRLGPELARDGDHTCYAGASAFLSTPSDLVRFAMAFNAGKLVQPATVDLLQTRQQVTSGEPTEYGLGWKIERLQLAGQSVRMAGHGTKQDFIGGTAYLMTFPERGLAVAVTTNTSFADTKAVALKVAETFAGAAVSTGSSR